MVDYFFSPEFAALFGKICAGLVVFFAVVFFITSLVFTIREGRLGHVIRKFVVFSLAYSIPLVLVAGMVSWALYGFFGFPSSLATAVFFILIMMLGGLLIFIPPFSITKPYVTWLHKLLFPSYNMGGYFWEMVERPREVQPDNNKVLAFEPLQTPSINFGFKESDGGSTVIDLSPDRHRRRAWRVVKLSSIEKMRLKSLVEAYDRQDVDELKRLLGLLNVRNKQINLLYLKDDFFSMLPDISGLLRHSLVWRKRYGLMSLFLNIKRWKQIRRASNRAFSLSLFLDDIGHPRYGYYCRYSNRLSRLCSGKSPWTSGM